MIVKTMYPKLAMMLTMAMLPIKRSDLIIGVGPLTVAQPGGTEKIRMCPSVGFRKFPARTRRLGRGLLAILRSFSSRHS